DGGSSAEGAASAAAEGEGAASAASEVSPAGDEWSPICNGAGFTTSGVHCLLTMTAGLPRTIREGGKLSGTNAPAARRVPLPIVTPPTMIACGPTQTSSSSTG